MSIEQEIRHVQTSMNVDDYNLFKGTVALRGLSMAEGIRLAIFHFMACELWQIADVPTIKQVKNLNKENDNDT